MPELPVFVDRRRLVRGVGDPHHLYPLPDSDWVLKITAAATVAGGTKNIEADPVLPRAGRLQAVHSKCPLLISRLSFPKPVHILLVRLPAFRRCVTSIGIASSNRRRASSCCCGRRKSRAPVARSWSPDVALAGYDLCAGRSVGGRMSAIGT